MPGTNCYMANHSNGGSSIGISNSSSMQIDGGHDSTLETQGELNCATLPEKWRITKARQKSSNFTSWGGHGPCLFSKTGTFWMAEWCRKDQKSWASRCVVICDYTIWINFNSMNSMEHFWKGKTGSPLRLLDSKEWVFEFDMRPTRHTISTNKIGQSDAIGTVSCCNMNLQ